LNGTKCGAATVLDSLQHNLSVAVERYKVWCCECFGQFTAQFQLESDECLFKSRGYTL